MSSSIQPGFDQTDSDEEKSVEEEHQIKKDAVIKFVENMNNNCLTEKEKEWMEEGSKNINRKEAFLSSCISSCISSYMAKTDLLEQMVNNRFREENEQLFKKFDLEMPVFTEPQETRSGILIAFNTLFKEKRVAEFLKETTAKDKGKSIPSKALKKAFHDWVKAKRIPIPEDLPMKYFVPILDNEIKYKKNETGSVFEGITWNTAYSSFEKYSKRGTDAKKQSNDDRPTKFQTIQWTDPGSLFSRHT